MIFLEFPFKKSDSACLLVFQTFVFKGEQTPFVFSRQKIWKALASVIEQNTNHKEERIQNDIIFLYKLLCNTFDLLDAKTFVEYFR